MRRLALLALLLPALVHAQDAAPLADRVVASLRVDLMADGSNRMADSLEAGTAGMPGGGFGGAFGAMAGAMRIDAAALTDSIRAALARSPRPDLLADALDYLESPEAARLQEVSPLVPSASPSDLFLLDPSSADGTLADSALTVRLLRASMAMATNPELQREMMEMMMGVMGEVVPAEEMAEQQAELDEALAMVDSPLMEQMQEMQLTVMVPAYRAVLGGLPDEVLRAGADYYESEAGQHVSLLTLQGMMRYQVPKMAEVMRSMAEELGPPPTPATDG